MAYFMTKQSSSHSDTNDTVKVCSIWYFKLSHPSIITRFCIYHLNISFLMKLYDATNKEDHIVCAWKLSVCVNLSAYTVHTLWFDLCLFPNQIRLNHYISQISFSNCPLPGCEYSHQLLYKVYPVSQLCVAMCHLSVIQNRI